MYQQQQFKSVLDMDHKKAQAFFMKPERYCTLNLPAYFTFLPILQYVSNISKGQEIVPAKDKTINCSYRIQIAKNNTLSYRTITLANPFLYYQLVKTITEEDSWNKIKARMKDLETSLVDRLAIPGEFTIGNGQATQMEQTQDSRENQDRHFIQGKQILSWWENFEQRSLSLSVEYKYMLCTDIADFYPSIYTHSIPWAIHENQVAKSAASKGKPTKSTTQLGDNIDKLIRGMQAGETLGIPQGSDLFDFIAEIVLAYADKQLENAIKEVNKNSTTGLLEVKIIRYRDDYRIFSNSLDSLKHVSLILHKVLGDLHLNINHSKTFISENPVRDAIKKDKLALLERGLHKRDVSKNLMNLLDDYIKKDKLALLEQALHKQSLQKQLMIIHAFSMEFPNSGSVIRLLREAFLRLEASTQIGTFREDPEILIAIVLDLILKTPGAYDTLISMLSVLIANLKERAQQEEICRRVLARLNELPQSGYLEVWIQYLLRRMKLEEATSRPWENKLCLFPDEGTDGSTLNLWDNSWLDTKYTKDFPMQSLYDAQWLQQHTGPIPSQETEKFGQPY